MPSGPGVVPDDFLSVSTIDEIKEYCMKNNSNGYITSLDAKKAYDSIPL